MRHVYLLVLAAIAAVFALVVQVGGAAPTAAVSLAQIGTFASNVPFDGEFGAAEIPSYDSATQRVFVVNGQQKQIDVLDISTPSTPTKIGSIALSGRPNSVAVYDGLVAVAVEADTKTDPGRVDLYSASCSPATCTRLNEIAVRALPDMLTFSPSGRYLLVANEGEPGAVDPMGTISVIDLRKGVDRPIVDTVDFASLDGQTVPAGVILQSGKLPSVDFEPEYITVSKNSKTAWVSLQEANAIAEIDVAGGTLVAVRGLGFKDHGLAQNSLDASDRDNAINMCAWANVRGMYQPDGIAAYQVKDSYYILSANEGDSRSADESRVGALAPAPFTAELRNNRNLGRLTVNKNLGLVGGVHQQLYVYGARSFSIWSETGARIYDSGNQVERIVGSFVGTPEPTSLALSGPAVPPAQTYKCPISTTEALPTAPAASTPANSNSEEGPSFDNRSDNKGPEREGTAIGKIGASTFAFIGLERAGGIVVYDVSDPAAPDFVQYVNPRNFAATFALPAAPGDWASAGDLGPEGVAFISAEDSPSGAPLLVVANEISGTTTIYSITST